MRFHSANESKLVPVEQRRFLHLFILQRWTHFLLETHRWKLSIFTLCGHNFRTDGRFLFDEEFGDDDFLFRLYLVNPLSCGGRVGRVHRTCVLEIAGNVSECKWRGRFWVVSVMIVHWYCKIIVIWMDSLRISIGRIALMNKVNIIAQTYYH